MRTNLDSEFKTDIDIEKKGAWLEINEKVKILVKRNGGANSAKIAEYTAKQYAPFIEKIKELNGKQGEGELIDYETEIRLRAELLADQLVLDWAGIDVEENGQKGPLAYNRSNCIELFTTYPDLAERVLNWSYVRRNFQEREELGNS